MSEQVTDPPRRMVQTLGYAPVGDNPWPRILRKLARVGVVLSSRQVAGSMVFIWAYASVGSSDAYAFFDQGLDGKGQVVGYVLVGGGLFATSALAIACGVGTRAARAARYMRWAALFVIVMDASSTAAGIVAYFAYTRTGWL